MNFCGSVEYLFASSEGTCFDNTRRLLSQATAASFYFIRVVIGTQAFGKL